MRKNLPINSNTRVRNKRFINITLWQLKLDEVPALYLPVLFTSQTPTNERKPPKSQLLAIQFQMTLLHLLTAQLLWHCSSWCLYTNRRELDEIKVKLTSVKEKILFLEQKLKKMNNEMLRLNNTNYDDCKVTFFTGYNF